jgi:hypothetical protein
MARADRKLFRDRFELGQRTVHAIRAALEAAGVT